MNIEYPPMLAGNSREQILQLRSYLYRLAEQLNFELEEKHDQSVGKTQGNNEYIPNGQRHILSAPDGWASITAASEYGANLTAIGNFKLFCAIISNGTASIPVIMYRHGNMIRGSVSHVIGGGVANIILSAEVTATPDIILRQTIYQHYTDTEITSGVLPYGVLEGYSVRELYAIVI